MLVDLQENSAKEFTNSAFDESMMSFDHAIAGIESARSEAGTGHSGS